VQVEERLVFNAIALIRGAALASFGLAHLPGDQVPVQLARGRLVRLLADCASPSRGTASTTSLRRPSRC
jgi:DNA-binding transcriptional LysR family regulator